VTAVSRPGATSEDMRSLGRAAVEQHRDRPFSVVTHAHMLADKARLHAYRSAIDALVGPDSEVVDIGTGTGILAAYAAERTKRTVHAIEVEPASVELAKRLFATAGLSNVNLVEGASYGKPVDAAPEVLVTETLGPVGIEEHIVETCREFCLRYPSVTTLIPHTLHLRCRPVRSTRLEDWREGVIANILSASFGSFRYSAVESELRCALSRQLLEQSVADAELLGPARTLATFSLGHSRSSRFQAKVAVPGGATAVHVYFEAELGAGQTISTALTEPVNHWGQYFVLRPPAARELLIAYTPGRQVFDCSWPC
jgi:hypothetical protein